MRTLTSDLAFALRLFRNNPGFTILAVFTLALGISANTTVFGWLDTVMLNSLPGASDPASLAVVETTTSDGARLVNTSFLDYKDLRDHARQIQGLAASRMTPTFIGEEGKTQRVFAELVSRNFFDVLGVRPFSGRLLRSSDCTDTKDTCALAVISHRLWRSRFHSDPAIAGKLLRIGRRQFTILGVAPPQFHGGFAGLAFDVWVPLNWAPALGTGSGTLAFRGCRDLTSTYARLHPNTTLAQAQSELRSLAARLAEAHPATNRGITFDILPLSQGHNGAQSLLQGPLRILMAIGVVLLLIVCANVANLLLARMVARRREFTIRLALGSGRSRLFRQILTETLLLASLGSLAGILLSQWLGNAIVYLLPPTDAPIAFSGATTLRTLLFTSAIAILVTVASGLAPAFISSRLNLHDALKDGGRSGLDGHTSHRLRALLVVVEVALASVAIIGAGLCIRSFRNAASVNPGFNTTNVIAANYYLSPAGYTGPQQRDFCIRLRERLLATPGIRAASYSDVIPLNFGASPWHQIAVEGYSPAPGENMNIFRALIPPHHLAFMNIALRQGRDFTPADDEKAPPIVIINEAFAHRYYPNLNPVGRRIRTDDGWRTIVGVAANSKYHSPLERPFPYIYTPFRQKFAPGLNFSFFIQHDGDPIVALAALRRESLALNPHAHVYNAAPLAEFTMASLYSQKVAASFLSILGALSLLLATIGLYSVLSYAVSQRAREIGIRMALGAQPSAVIFMILRQGLALTLPGLAAGILAGLATSRLLASFLIDIAPADPTTYLAAAAFLAAAATLACLIPALRATLSNPTTNLRSL